jgi:CTP:molybdopterin cytidylyltransferase MocA
MVSAARRTTAEDLARGFVAAGASDVEIVAGPADERTFGARLRDLVTDVGEGGLIVLGSGSIPLATVDDLDRLVATASSGEPRAVTNNRYSSDVLAIGRASCLATVPELATDNLLPRWLSVRAGVRVDELPDRDRLALDVDSPLDLELLRRHPACPQPLMDLAASASSLLGRAAATLDALAQMAADRTAEILVSGRLSATGLRRLELGTACRVRAIVEERGLRASADLDEGAGRARPPASILGMALDRGGPGAIGDIVGRLATGALIDTRVLLAHRLGPDEAAWPAAEDRFACDLLLPARVLDPRLRELTSASADAALPIALGGHTLVGPGLPLALGLPLDAPWS